MVRVGSVAALQLLYVAITPSLDQYLSWRLFSHPNSQLSQKRGLFVFCFFACKHLPGSVAVDLEGFAVVHVEVRPASACALVRRGAVSPVFAARVSVNA